eukprot:5072304-Prymnesium_polylepis.2
MPPRDNLSRTASFAAARLARTRFAVVLGTNEKDDDGAMASRASSGSSGEAEAARRRGVEAPIVRRVGASPGLYD